MRRGNAKASASNALVWHGWTVGVLIAVTAAVGTTSMPAEATGVSCEAIATQHLERLNVDPSDVRKISCVADRRGGRDGGRVVGVTAWVSLHSCKGSLVIDMSLHGQVRQVYGRGACDLGAVVKTR
jgi:hypothetical protein